MAPSQALANKYQSVSLGNDPFSHTHNLVLAKGLQPKFFSSALPKFGKLKSAIPALPFDKDKEYDLIVIGGGTGGITAAVEARELGMSVALFDYVAPSPQGSQWGLGGTCVNVGCIPKKLYHIAACTHDNYKAAEDFGWEPHESSQHKWNVLRDNI